MSATVTDLRSATTTIRLYGVDAPERDQTCLDREGKTYACGAAAADALKELADGKDVKCERPAKGPRKDGRGRYLALCHLTDGRELNAEMVRAGLAVAFRRYSLDFVKFEAEARTSRRGLWVGRFVLPACWRAHKEHRPCKDAPPEGFLEIVPSL